MKTFFQIGLILIIFLPSIGNVNGQSVLPAYLSAQQYYECNGQTWVFGSVTNSEKETTVLIGFFDDLTILDTTLIQSNTTLMYRMALLVLDESGHVVNYTLIDNAFTNISRPLQTDPEGNFYIAGSIVDELIVGDDTLSNLCTTPTGAQDIFLIKLNRQLEYQWGKVISGNCPDDVQSFSVDESGLYLTLSHYYWDNSAIPQPIQVSYPDAEPLTILYPTIACAKFDFDGEVVWRQTIDSHNYGVPFGLFINSAPDNHAEFFLTSTHTLYLGSDSIPVTPGTGYGKQLKITLDDHGQMISHQFIPWEMSLLDVIGDESGNMFFLAWLHQDLTWGNFTFNYDEQKQTYLFGRINDQFLPEWIEPLSFPASPINPNIAISSFDKKMYFAIETYLDIVFAGQTLTVPSYTSSTHTGRFNQAGEIESLITIPKIYGVNINSLSFNDCGELMEFGAFNQEVVLGPDTIRPVNAFIKNGFIAKLQFEPAPTFVMPTDTSGCDSVTLTGPAGWHDYTWNNVPGSSVYTAKADGVVILKATSNSGCRQSQTTWVDVRSADALNIGNDTLISNNDSIVFAIGEDFQFPVWSTGDTSHSIMIRGELLSPGSYPIGVVAFSNGCETSDNLVLKVINSDGIDGYTSVIVTISPNPVLEEITVSADTEITNIELFNLAGDRLSVHFTKLDTTTWFANIKDNSSGQYLAKITGRNFTLVRKIIKTK